MTPEKEVQNDIVKYVKELRDRGLPIEVVRTQAGGYAYHMGEPDLHLYYNGIAVDIEVKAPGRELRPMQEKWKERCEKVWHKRCICADSVQTVKDYLWKEFGIR